MKPGIVLGTGWPSSHPVQPLVRLLRCLLLALLLAVPPAHAEDSETAYVRIWNLIEQADALRDDGQRDAARAKYEKALQDLEAFRQQDPTWNPKLVNYRLNYLTQKVDEMAQPAAASEVASNAPASPGKTGSGSTQTAAAAAATGVEVKVLDAGREPRQVLRLHAAEGERQTLSLTMKMHMEIQSGEMPAQPMNMPPITLTLDSTVTNVSADGDISYLMRVVEAGVKGDATSSTQMVESLNVAMGALKGLVTSGAVSSRGFSRGVQLDLPANANPAMRQSLDQAQETFSQISTILPEEAVGPGARWQTMQPLKSQGMSIRQTATYEIVTMEEGRLAMKLSLQQQANPQKIESPGMPGMKVDLTRMSGSGTGTITLDLGRLMPVGGSIDSKTDMAMTIDMGKQKQAMNMKMGMVLSMESGPAQ